MTNAEAHTLIYGLAVEDFDNHDERLPFDEANDRRGEMDAKLVEAIEHLGEDEAAEYYDEEFDSIVEDERDLER
jgi:hypothetical protein